MRNLISRKAVSGNWGERIQPNGNPATAKKKKKKSHKNAGGGEFCNEQGRKPASKQAKQKCTSLQANRSTEVFYWLVVTCLRHLFFFSDFFFHAKKMGRGSKSLTPSISFFMRIFFSATISLVSRSSPICTSLRTPKACILAAENSAEMPAKTTQRTRMSPRRLCPSANSTWPRGSAERAGTSGLARGWPFEENKQGERTPIDDCCLHTTPQRAKKRNVLHTSIVK